MWHVLVRTKVCMCWWRNLQGRRNLAGLGVDGRIILKWIWDRTETGDGLLSARYETCGSVKLRLFLYWLRKYKLLEDWLVCNYCHLSLPTELSFRRCLWRFCLSAVGVCSDDV